MYKILFSLLLLVTGINSYAQSSVKGYVADTAKAPVPNCKATLLRMPDSSIVKETLTGRYGLYLFDSLQAGDYIVKLSKAGFADNISAPIVVEATQVDMGVITLSNTGIGLNEVAVSSYKPTIAFKNGMVVMNVENNMLASGSTVLEMLKMLPGVVLDAQDNITITGKSGVNFMIDGRLQQMPVKQMITILSSMSAESITSIELMKNPSAKYDAAGSAGLINIVTKKAKVKGYNCNLSQNTSWGKKLGSVTAGSLNFKSNRLSVFANGSYWSRDIVTETTMNRTLNDGAGAVNLINSNGTATNYKRTVNVRAGLEYEISPRLVIGTNLSANPSSSNMSQAMNTAIAQSAAIGYSKMDNSADNRDQYNNPSANVYALFTPDTTGTQLKFSADYTNYTEAYAGLNRSRFYNNSSTEVRPMQGYRNLQDLDFKITTSKLDFTKKLSKAVTLEAGAKASFVDNTSDFSLDLNAPGTDVYHEDTTLSNNYEYKERILAAYLNFTRESARTSLQAGLRAEQTDIDAVNKTSGYKVPQSYLNLFPNASFNYRINAKNSLQFTYSYRIDRPNYDQLNPLRYFYDPLNYATGNPQLKPQYSHNVSAEYTFNNFLTSSLGFMQVNNSIYNYSYLDGGLVQVDTSVNYGSGFMVTYGLFMQAPVAKWYNLQASGHVMYGKRTGVLNGVNTEIATVPFYATVNNDITLPKNFKVQVNLIYNSPYKDGIQTYEARTSLDVAIQKKLLKNKMGITLQINDLLYTNVMRMTNVLPEQSIYFSQRQDSRRIRLVVNYRFGNMKVNRKVRDANEAKRIKKAE